MLWSDDHITLQEYSPLPPLIILSVNFLSAV